MISVNEYTHDKLLGQTNLITNLIQPNNLAKWDDFNSNSTNTLIYRSSFLYSIIFIVEASKIYISNSIEGLGKDVITPRDITPRMIDYTLSAYTYGLIDSEAKSVLSSLINFRNKVVHQVNMDKDVYNLEINLLLSKLTIKGILVRVINQLIRIQVSASNCSLTDSKIFG